MDIQFLRFQKLSTEPMIPLVAHTMRKSNKHRFVRESLILPFVLRNEPETHDWLAEEPREEEQVSRSLALVPSTDPIRK